MKLLATVAVVALLLADVTFGDWQTDIGDWGNSLNSVDSVNSVEELEQRHQTSGLDYKQVHQGWNSEE